jgi:hypothetical protein
VISSLIMPPKKKTKVVGLNADDVAAVAVHQLEDIVAIILGWLCVEEIMGKRRVCKKWKEAVKKTIIPLSDFYVNSPKKYNAMNVMTRAMPNLQRITIGTLGHRQIWSGPHKWSDGEDPYEEVAAETADNISHDIEIISNFNKLRVLDISTSDLNGRYPFLFNSFPLLQKLTIYISNYLVWDLDMLAGLPLLKELRCLGNERVTGSINSLRVLKYTLEVVKINICRQVEGNFIDLADFPHLKVLNLPLTAVTGDIRDIGEHDFPSLEDLDLPSGVYGGYAYEMQSISDAPDLIRAVYLLKKQRPALIMSSWSGKLSEHSPDWYDSADDDDDTPPFHLRFIEAGSRIGYRWETEYDIPCEVNWLDPEPESGSREYEDYISDYQHIQGEISLYRGYYEPPTEEQYTLLYEEHLADIQIDDEEEFESATEYSRN